LGLGFRGVTGVESSCDVPLGPATGSLSSSFDPTLSLPRAFRSSLGFIGFRDPAEDTGFVEAGMLGLHVPAAASASSDFLVNPPLPRFSHVRHRLADQHLLNFTREDLPLDIVFSEIIRTTISSVIRSADTRMTH
jgi:hypothetical protein